MPCHCPMKTSVMRSCTEVVPSAVTLMVSSKFEMRKSRGNTGQANRTTQHTTAIGCNARQNHSEAAPSRWICMGLKFDRNRLAVGRSRFKELPLHESEHPGKNIRRK